MESIRASDIRSKDVGTQHVINMVDITSSEAVRHSAFLRNEAYSDADLRLAEETMTRVPGLPSSLSVVQAAQLFRAYGHAPVVGQAIITTPPERPLLLTQQKQSRRGLIQRQVGHLHAKTGEEYATIYARLNRLCGGTKTDKASLEQLDQRIEYLDTWLST